MYRLTSTEGPDFATWSQANLAKFAAESYAKIREQEDEIMRLRQDLKAAINAYRDLLRR
jgi:hypothetical protein